MSVIFCEKHNDKIVNAFLNYCTVRWFVECMQLEIPKFALVLSHVEYPSSTSSIRLSYECLKHPPGINCSRLALPGVQKAFPTAANRVQTTWAATKIITSWHAWFWSRG